MADEEYTPQRLIEEMNAGIKEFGRYTFFDKGAHAVMDLGPVVEWLHTKSPEFVGEFLNGVIGPRARPPLNRMHLAAQTLEEQSLAVQISKTPTLPTPILTTQTFRAQTLPVPASTERSSPAPCTAKIRCFLRGLIRLGQE